MKLHTKILLIALAGLYIQSASAQNNYTSVTTGPTPVSVLASPAVISKLTVTATTSSSTTFRFYDSSGTSTNIVLPTRQRPVSYSTNFNTVFTNINGVVITNTFSGTVTTMQTVAGGTVERPVVWSVTIPGNSTREVDTRNRIVVNGLLAVSSAAGVVEVQY